MAISRDDLYKNIMKWRDGSSKANSASKRLQNDYLDYLDSVLASKGVNTFAVDPDTGKEGGDYTPEFEATQAEVMEDLGLGDDDMDLIFNGEGDFDDYDSDESLTIGGTDIYKEPFTEEQLATLRKDDIYNKLSTDEFNALQAADRAAAKTIHDAKLKRAKELLEGSGDTPSDKPHDTELAGETTPEEDFMQRAAEGKIPATSGVLAGDLTPEEIKMIQMFRNKNQMVSDERMKNITNRLAVNLSKHRW